MAFALGLALGFLLTRSSTDRPDSRPAEHAPRSPASTQRTSTTESSDCAHAERQLNCVRYLGNYDGDTIKIEVPGVHPLLGHAISVRVFGIDTAEMKGRGPCEKPRAREARELVAKTLGSAKRIELRDVQRDKYFRILANVFADGVSVSQLLLDRKLAYRYDGGTKARVDWCRRS